MSSSNYQLSNTVPDDQHSNQNSKLCGLCNNNRSKYCCPRCEILYCSLNCYKSEKHSSCSENFYRECISEELANHDADDEIKNKTLEILKRMQNEDLGMQFDDDDDYKAVLDSDDGSEGDLEERLKDLDLNNADQMWNALTEDEKNEFRSLCNGGDITSVIPLWEPWWMYHKERKVVEDLSEENIEEKEALKICPALKSVISFEKLTKVEPSPAIKMNIANVLASYAFVMRYFNGEVEPVEGTLCCLMICGNLDANENCYDLETAVASAAQKCLQSDFIETDKESLEVMKHDTFLILQGPSHENRDHYSKAALSHLHEIFSEARKTERRMKKTSSNKNEFSKIFPDHKREHLPALETAKLMKCLKKLEYYLSYVQSYGMDFE